MAAHTPMIMSEIAVPIAERVHKPSFIASFCEQTILYHSPSQVLVCREIGKVPPSTNFGGVRVNQDLCGRNDQRVRLHHLKASINKCLTAQTRGANINVLTAQISERLVAKLRCHTQRMQARRTKMTSP